MFFKKLSYIYSHYLIHQGKKGFISRRYIGINVPIYIHTFLEICPFCPFIYKRFKLLENNEGLLKFLVLFELALVLPSPKNDKTFPLMDL